MIGFLRGKVAYLLADDCLLDVGGVGYRVTVSGMTRSKLRQGEQAMLFTYLCTRRCLAALWIRNTGRIRCVPAAHRRFRHWS